MSHNASNILVTVREWKSDPHLNDSADRSLAVVAEAVTRSASSYVQVSPALLEAQIKGFVDQLGGILQKIPDTLGLFRLDSLEISAEITAAGKVSLLGTGGEMGGKGGLTFNFKRIDEKCVA